MVSGAGAVGSASRPRGSSENTTCFFLRFLSEGSNKGCSAMSSSSLALLAKVVLVVLFDPLTRCGHGFDLRSAEKIEQPSTPEK